MAWFPRGYAGAVSWRRRFMIEPIMFFGIGFLVAALVGLVVIPLVHGRAVRDQLRTTEEEYSVKTSAMLDAQRALGDKEAELAKLMGALDERSSLADAQKIDIIALKTQVDALKDRLTEASNELKTVEDRRDSERVELKAATQELSEERGKVENLGRRVSELEQALVAQTTEAEILGRRAQDLETRLGEQSRLLAESGFELKQLRGQIETARKTESDLRTAIAEIDGRTSAATEKLRAENARLQTETDRMKDERDRLPK